MNIKKSFAAGFVAILGVLLSAQAVEFSEGLKAGLIAYYPFDGGLADVCGIQSDCVLGNAAYTTDRNGTEGFALKTGASCDARIPNSPSFAALTGDFTSSFWARIDSYYAGSGWALFMSKGADYPRQFCLGLNVRYEFMFEDSSQVNAGGASIHARLRTLPEQGKWFHMVVVHQARNVAVYLDGQLISYSTTYSGSLQSNNDDIYLGADPPGENERYEGALDEISYWNRALDATEVAALYETYTGKNPGAGEDPDPDPGVEPDPEPGVEPDPEPEPDPVFPTGFELTDPYYVIDLAAGPKATSYPVASMKDLPKGGWKDVHKTSWLVLHRIESGVYTMGDQVHGGEIYPNVSVSKPYYMGVFEVTQRQWELVMGTRPSFCKSEYAKRPVENVTYAMIRGSSKGAQWPAGEEVDDASFLAVIRARTGLNFDLPTEAQWQYACRAGTTTDYNNGTDYENPVTDEHMAVVGRYQASSRIHEGAREWFDSSRNSALVGSYVPNAWGLYDMHGNVSEWCRDWMGELQGDVKDPIGPETGTQRVRCGGSWGDDARNTTSASRAGSSPWMVNSGIGFRLAVVPAPAPDPIELKTLAESYAPGVAIEPIEVVYNGEIVEPKISVTGLPKGLAFKDGVISGTPSVPGESTVTVTVVSGGARAQAIGVGGAAVETLEVQMRVAHYADELAAGLAAAYGPFIPGVAVAENLSAVAGWKPSTLPAGLKFDAKTGLLSGAPKKPGETIVYFKKTVGPAVHVASTTVAVAPLRKVEVTVAEGLGTVKGAGDYAANAVAKLTAKPGKGYAVVGWFRGDACLSRTATFAYSVGVDEVEALTVKFAPIADDAASLRCSFGGQPLAADAATTLCVTNYQGVAVEWPVAFEALTLPTLKVSGLPSGLAYKEGVVAGVPTVASRVDRKTGVAVPSVATFTLKTLAGSVAKYTVQFVVLPRAGWAVGSYSGVWSVDGEIAGAATFTLAANGKGSGRITFARNGKSATATLTLTAIAAYDPVAGTAALEAALKGTGIESRVLRLVLRTQDGLGVLATEEGSELALTQVVWARTDLQLPVFPTGRAALTLTTAEGLVLTFGAKGAVKFAGKVAGDDGVPVSVSGSSVVQALWDEALGANGQVLVYANAKKNLTQGFAKVVHLRFETDENALIRSVAEVAPAAL